MGKETNVTCDHCGEKLNIDSMYPHNWGLTLRAEDFGFNTADRQYLVHQEPPINREYTFCGKECLREWLNN